MLLLEMYWLNIRIIAIGVCLPRPTPRRYPGDDQTHQGRLRVRTVQPCDATVSKGRYLDTERQLRSEVPADPNHGSTSVQAERYVVPDIFVRRRRAE